ncbi:MAG TPA: hypothetical protein DDW81_03595 [Cryomorphaceae bacterium]|nr:hypothetical protein [Owenweeksia sp.]HBF19154.1 hypothetical protein [Cryomorphaceae bacterium]HCQ15608.1 hypothetical protein [Cryomorphaceae bacterium]|tara:strand:- start:191 stop:433 length:243 start_codon:yes stop_codon:yes gene_type:complete
MFFISYGKAREKFTTRLDYFVSAGFTSVDGKKERVGINELAEMPENSLNKACFPSTFRSPQLQGPLHFPAYVLLPRTTIN